MLLELDVISLNYNGWPAAAVVCGLLLSLR